MMPQYLVGTRYISSAPPTRVILITLTALFVAFFSGYHHLHAQDDSTILYPGTYQAEDAHLILPKSARIIGVDNAQDVDAIDTDAATLTARGTEIRMRWQTVGELIVEVNNEIILFDPKLKFPDPFYGRVYSHVLQRELHWIVASLYLQFSAIAETDVQLNHGWYEAFIAHSTSAETCTFKIWALNRGRERGMFQIDSITVLDRSFENIFPYIAAIGIAIGMTLFVVITALRERRQQK
jgi:hypothetical protein